jgi:hypothetical protein
MTKSHWLYLFHKKKWRAETSQPWLEFDNFKPRIERGICICNSRLNGSYFFFWAMIGLQYSERASQALAKNYTNVAA